MTEKIEQMDLNYSPEKKVEITPEIFEEIMQAVDQMIADVKNERIEDIKYSVHISQVYFAKIKIPSIEISKKYNLNLDEVFDLMYKELIRRKEIDESEVLV